MSESDEEIRGGRVFGSTPMKEVLLYRSGKNFLREKKSLKTKELLKKITYASSSQVLPKGRYVAEQLHSTEICLFKCFDLRSQYTLNEPRRDTKQNNCYICQL